jgi:hypothetical protein
MLYIHRTSCISPQQTFGIVDIEKLQPSVDNQLPVLEASYTGIPPGVLRRMGKAVKISVGAAMPLLKDTSMPDGIIIGSGNGGMEDSVKFLDQIVQYAEGMLTPANFVQSTANAMAGQIGMLTRNHGYNITHIHRGLAFECALLDAMMFATEMPSSMFILGGADEISTYNNNIETLAGAFKRDMVSNGDLYASDTPGSLAGEGAAMFLVSGLPSELAITAVETLHEHDRQVVCARLEAFLDRYVPQGLDLVLTGENGDCRLKTFYDGVESVISKSAGIARFKHMSGEHPTAAAFGTWLACHVLERGAIPGHAVKKPMGVAHPSQILLYNTFKGIQHSFLLVSRVNG